MARKWIKKDSGKNSCPYSDLENRESELISHLKTQTVRELRAQLKAKHISTVGNKSTLVRRLVNAIITIEKGNNKINDSSEVDVPLSYSDVDIHTSYMKHNKVTFLNEEEEEEKEEEREEEEEEEEEIEDGSSSIENILTRSKQPIRTPISMVDIIGKWSNTILSDDDDDDDDNDDDIVIESEEEQEEEEEEEEEQEDTPEDNITLKNKKQTKKTTILANGDIGSIATYRNGLLPMTNNGLGNVSAFSPLNFIISHGSSTQTTPLDRLKANNIQKRKRGKNKPKESTLAIYTSEFAKDTPQEEQEYQERKYQEQEDIESCDDDFLLGGGVSSSIKDQEPLPLISTEDTSINLTRSNMLTHDSFLVSTPVGKGTGTFKATRLFTPQGHHTQMSPSDSIGMKRTPTSIMTGGLAHRFVALSNKQEYLHRQTIRKINRDEIDHSPSPSPAILTPLNNIHFNSEEEGPISLKAYVFSCNIRAGTMTSRCIILSESPPCYVDVLFKYKNAGGTAISPNRSFGSFGSTPATPTPDRDYYYTMTPGQDGVPSIEGSITKGSTLLIYKPWFEFEVGARTVVMAPFAKVIATTPPHDLGAILNSAVTLPTTHTMEGKYVNMDEDDDDDDEEEVVVSASDINIHNYDGGVCTSTTIDVQYNAKHERSYNTKHKQVSPIVVDQVNSSIVKRIKPLKNNDNEGGSDNNNNNNNNEDDEEDGSGDNNEEGGSNVDNIEERNNISLVTTVVPRKDDLLWYLYNMHTQSSPTITTTLKKCLLECIRVVVQRVYSNDEEGWARRMLVECASGLVAELHIPYPSSHSSINTHTKGDVDEVDECPWACLLEATEGQTYILKGVELSKELSRHPVMMRRSGLSSMIAYLHHNRSIATSPPVHRCSTLHVYTGGKDKTQQATHAYLIAHHNPIHQKSKDTNEYDSSLPTICYTSDDDADDDDDSLHHMYCPSQVILVKKLRKASLGAGVMLPHRISLVVRVLLITPTTTYPHIHRTSSTNMITSSSQYLPRHKSSYLNDISHPSQSYFLFVVDASIDEHSEDQDTSFVVRVLVHQSFNSDEMYINHHMETYDNMMQMQDTRPNVGDILLLRDLVMQDAEQWSPSRLECVLVADRYSIIHVAREQHNPQHNTPKKEKEDINNLSTIHIHGDGEKKKKKEKEKKEELSKHDKEVPEEDPSSLYSLEHISGSSHKRRKGMMVALATTHGSIGAFNHSITHPCYYYPSSGFTREVISALQGLHTRFPLLPSVIAASRLSDPCAELQIGMVVEVRSAIKRVLKHKDNPCYIGCPICYSRLSCWYEDDLYYCNTCMSFVNPQVLYSIIALLDLPFQWPAVTLQIDYPEVKCLLDKPPSLDDCFKDTLMNLKDWDITALCQVSSLPSTEQEFLKLKLINWLDEENGI